jgi:quercetin dioxygenase-like cupin family protein
MGDGFVGGRKVTSEKFSAQQALVLAPGAGEVIPARPEGSFVTIKVGGPFLQCPLTVAEGHFDPSQGAPEWTSPHRHHQFTEMTYVLEGEMTFLIGEELHRVGAGAFICIPPEVVHAYVPSRDSMTSVLFIALPGGFEGMFEEAAHLPPDADPRVFWSALNQKYDTEVVGPPPQP